MNILAGGAIAVYTSLLLSYYDYYIASTILATTFLAGVAWCCYQYLTAKPALRVKGDTNIDVFHAPLQLLLSGLDDTTNKPSSSPDGSRLTH